MKYTALHRASSQGHTEVIEFLIDKHCNLDIQDEVKLEPLSQSTKEDGIYYLLNIVSALLPVIVFVYTCSFVLPCKYSVIGILM